MAVPFGPTRIFDVIPVGFAPCNFSGFPGGKTAAFRRKGQRKRGVKNSACVFNTPLPDFKECADPSGFLQKKVLFYRLFL